MRQSAGNTLKHPATQSILDTGRTLETHRSLCPI